MNLCKHCDAELSTREELSLEQCEGCIEVDEEHENWLNESEGLDYFYNL